MLKKPRLILMQHPAVINSVCGMKAAAQLLDELHGRMRPTTVTAVWLTEVVPIEPEESNWNAGAGPMNPEALRSLRIALGILRGSDPRIDWSAASVHPIGVRRIERRMSEGES